MVLSNAQVQEAIGVGSTFWTALAEDDDETLRGLLTATVLAILALGELVPGPIDVEPRSFEDLNASPGPGIARRLRAHLATEFEMDGLPGLASTAELLEGDQLRFTYPVVGIARPMLAGVEISVWRLEFMLDEGRWLVDPIRGHYLPAIGTIDLRSLD